VSEIARKAAEFFSSCAQTIPFRSSARNCKVSLTLPTACAVPQIRCEPFQTGALWEKGGSGRFVVRTKVLKSSARADHSIPSPLRKIAEVLRQVSFRSYFRCAQNCAHSADLAPRELHPHLDERTGKRLLRNYVPRFVRASKRQNPIPLVGSSR
jgi:hypothetical protein